MAGSTGRTLHFSLLWILLIVELCIAGEWLVNMFCVKISDRMCVTLCACVCVVVVYMQMYLHEFVIVSVCWEECLPPFNVCLPVFLSVRLLVHLSIHSFICTFVLLVDLIVFI